MGYNWENSPEEVKDFIENLKDQITKIFDDNLLGIYLHGSLAMGGFHPRRSDIDLIVVTKRPIDEFVQKECIQLFLARSTNPYPTEISFLNENQLKFWIHPCPYDFHYSEYWREYFSHAMFSREKEKGVDKSPKVDGDLAAHITIINQRGICLFGEEIEAVFPKIPKKDYLDSILSDYEECCELIHEKPIYAVLNMLRVLWYVKEGEVSSKEEAANWGLKYLSKSIYPTIKKAKQGYAGEEVVFHSGELSAFKTFIEENISL